VVILVLNNYVLIGLVILNVVVTELDTIYIDLLDGASQQLTWADPLRTSG
jgi:hypothetical protein